MKNLLIKYISFLLIFSFLSLFSPKRVLAGVTLYQDNFSSVASLNNWVIKPDSTKTYWSVDEVEKVLKVIIPKKDTLTTAFYQGSEKWPSGENWINYSIKMKIFSQSGVDQTIAFRVKDENNYYRATFRYFQAEHGGNIYLAKVINGSNTTLGIYELNPGELELNHWYEIEIIIKNTNIQVFLKDLEKKQIFNFTDSDNSLNKGGVFLQSWSGAISYVLMKFTDIDIESLDNPPTLLLPGLGASWNLESILHDNEGGTWGKPPILDTYKNFRQTMLSDGSYKEGQNYDEFYYNWKKELDDPSLATASVTNTYSVKDLKDKVDAFYTSNGDEKINLVGHSLGGVLARAYAQRYGTEKINKIVTVGSPHEGVVKAYNVWEGGEVIDTRRITFYDLILQAVGYYRQRYFKQVSVLEALRKAAPSAKNLLPTFDFLIPLDGPIIKAENMKQKNTFLFALNPSLNDSIKGLLATVAGRDDDPELQHDTLEWLKVMNPTMAEKMLGYWEDGKPYVALGSDDGDLTVLLRSATISGVPAFYISGVHDQIIQNTEGLNKIMEALGLNFTPVIDNSLAAKIPILLFWLHSPANLKVSGPGLEAGDNASNCQECLYSPQDKLILINQAPGGNYELLLTPQNAGGDYQLDISQITPSGDEWFSLKGNIGSQPQTYQLTFNPDSPQKIPLTLAEAVFDQTIKKWELLDSYINNLKISYRLKSRLRTILKPGLKLLTQAKAEFLKKNYQASALKLQGVYPIIYSLRNEVNAAGKKGLLSEADVNYLKNESFSISELLNTAFLKIKDKGGAKTTLAIAQKNLNVSRQLYQALENRLGPNPQNNAVLGSIVFSAQTMLNESEDALDHNRYDESFIDSLNARYLILEANNYLR